MDFEVIYSKVLREEGGVHYSFFFFERMELQRKDIQLSSDGFLTNVITQESLTMKEDSNTPWQDAQEKPTKFLEALIDLYTQDDNAILDITTSTC